MKEARISMRFETKTLQEQINILRRLHRFLNDLCFDNALNEDIIIEIQDMNKYKDEDEFVLAICGVRPRPRNHTIEYDGLLGENTDNDEYELATAIIFDTIVIEDAKKLKTQKEQVLFIAYIMLHEMVHQYCHENGIEDWGTHDDSWKNIARKFGLSYVFDCNGTERETIEPWKVWYLNLYFRLR